jgi:hypothetical protein
LYGCSGRHAYNADLRCIEWATGEVKWTVPRLTRSSLMYADDHFFCLTEYGDLFVFQADPEQFLPVSKAKLEDERGEPLLEYPCWAAPILAHGLLYVRGKDRLVCLDLRP